MSLAEIIGTAGDNESSITANGSILPGVYEIGYQGADQSVNSYLQFVQDSSDISVQIDLNGIE